jgi:hypothetical protein
VGRSLGGGGAARQGRPGVGAGGLGGSLEPANRQRTDGDNSVPWWAPCAAVQAAATGCPGGGSAASPSAARSRRTACGSVTAPRIRRAPPQCGLTRISIANTRRNSVAHDIVISFGLSSLVKRLQVRLTVPGR